VLVGLLQGVCGLTILFYFFLLYFHIMSQVLVGLPRKVGGLAILFYFSIFLSHAPGARRASLRGWWPSYFICFVLFVFHFILVYFYHTHQVFVGLPQGLVALFFCSICFVLFCFVLFCFVCILVYFHNTHQVLVGLL
jgi:hypothetical protein